MRLRDVWCILPVMSIESKSILNLTKRLVEQFGPRAPGSSESRACADALADIARGSADSVKTEDFRLSPAAFLGWIRILVAAYALAVAGLWLGWYWASAALLLAAMAILIAQFFLYKEVLDFLYPKTLGRNVLASIEPRDEVKGELMVSGHHDSARIFNFLYHQPGLYALRVNGGIGSLAGLTLVSLILGVLSSFQGRIPWAWIPSTVFTLLALLVFQLWFFASPRHTPGAGDNLASSAVAWEFLTACAKNKKQGKGFKHLRITAVSWDAEEAGLRGSRAWRKARSKDPREHPVWNLNLECLYGEQDLFLLTSDINGSVPLSKPLAERCARILEDRLGRTVKTSPIAFLTGGTDSGETAKAGVKATTLMGMPWQNDAHSAVYHTPRDTVEAVSEGAVDAAYYLAGRLAEELDQELSS
jgi:aminopeptidase YwaD